MQRYRVNYHLLFGLLIGSVVVSVSMWFLWKWQLSRKASWYRERAEVALKEDDKLEAFEYLEKFVKLRADDTDARVQLATVAAEILELEGVSPEDQRMAYGILDQTVRHTGDPVARRKLADLQIRIGRPQDAITHYNELLKTDSDNAEVKALLCRALFSANNEVDGIATACRLIGLDMDSETFDDSKAEAPHQPEIYSTLSSVIIRRDNNMELAGKIMEKLVEANPDSSVAHLERSIFLYSSDKKDEAAAELEEAHRLDPNSSDVLYRQAAVASDDGELDHSCELAAKGVKVFPDEMRFYRMLAINEMKRKNYDESVAALDQAIKQFGKERSIEFMIRKIDHLLAQEKIADARKVIVELEEMRAPRLKPLVEYQKARLTFVQKKWAEAAQQLQRVRPQMVDFVREQAICGTLLGEAYEKLGKLDLARQMFELVAGNESLGSDDPVRVMASNRLADTNKRLGLASSLPANDLNSIVQAMMAKPTAEQDWAQIDAFVQEIVDKRGLTESQKKLLEAQVYLQRKMVTEAKEAIRDAARLDPNDPSIRLNAVKVLVLDPPAGPPKALELLERIEKEQGASLDTRGLKVEAVAAIGGDEVGPKLRALAEGTDSWSAEQRMPLLANIGLKLMAVGDLAGATEYLGQAADLAPDNLPLRTQLFEIALQQRDAAAMQEAQERILEVVKTKEDGNYILSEVKRRLVTADNTDADKESLREARAMLDDALTRRPQWHELHVLYGQLLLHTGQETELALKHLDDALKYGPPNPLAVGLQVKLLAQRGDVKQAREKMELLPKEVRGRVLDRSEAALYAATGELDAALQAAKEEVERKPKDAATQSWYGSLAMQMGKFEEAAAAYSEACKLAPQEHDHWMKLVSVYAQMQDADSIERVFREAQLALDPEFLPLVQAKFFELQGRWTGAEDIYMSLYKDQFGRADVAQRMASFYLLWALADPTATQKAFPYINSILRDANEGKLPQDHPAVNWARERAARWLASTGRYQDSLKAERMLKEIAPDGVVPRNFQTLYSQILSSRADPVSIQNAIAVLSDLSNRGMLGKQEALLLAKLYARTNNWKQGKALMLDALGVYGSDPEVWSTYINLLIGQKEFTQAAQRLTRFAEISDNKFEVFQLRTHLAHEQGDQAEVKRLLKSMLPPNLGPATPLQEEQLQLIKAIAGLAVSFEETELAEELLKLYIRRKPEGVGDLVNVTALYGSVDEALPMMQKLAPQAPVEIAQLGVQMLRDRRAKLGDQYDDEVEELVTAALRDDPDSAVRLVTRAEMYEVMERYEEAIKAYEEVVNRDELGERPVAAVMNNLAFLLAQTNQRLDDAQELVDDAIEILGPVADALDTRAVVRMARKEYPLAVDDMLLAVSVDPTPVKYYHLAKAHALAGNGEAALEAWQSAQDMGIKKDLLPLIEQPGFAETESLIENLSSVESN